MNLLCGLSSVYIFFFFVGDRGSRVVSSPCNRKVAGSSPGLDSLGRCVLGQDTSPVAYWWWSEGPVAPVSGSLVFIQRDYSEGTVCRFQAKFPSELDNRIERTLLEETVKTLNSYYAEAEKIGGQSYLEGCLACATAYIIFLCMETRYEKVLRKISGFIQEQNEKIYAPRGLLLTDPIERGMRVLEISVFEDRGSGGSSPSSTMSSGSSAR
uniref:Golgin A7 family member B n=1 Tax=Haplochromis burtoni TaxID=8153 RepID=A0A3Q2X8P1_HAPBU